MNNQSRYTAQEMRKMADCINNIKQSEMPSWKEGEIITGGDLCRSAEMLRQAADAEEELAKVKASKNRWMQYQETAAGERNVCIDELRKKDLEIAQLKARLKAADAEDELAELRDQVNRDFGESLALTARLKEVVKECEKWKWADDNWCTSVKDATDTHNKCIDRIRRAAEGEGSANA